MSNRIAGFVLHGLPLVASLLLPARSLAQCLQYETLAASNPSFPLRFSDAAAWNDGSGPKLLLARSATFGSSPPAVNVWDGARAYELGPELTGSANRVGVFDLGDGPRPYVAGNLQILFQGQSLRTSVARWTGTSWERIGEGQPELVAYDMALHDDGSGPALYVTGAFEVMSAVPAMRIARWRLGGWSPVGAIISEIPVALRSADLGVGPRLYITLGNQPVQGGGITSLMQWDGSALTPFPDPLPIPFGSESISTVWGSRLYAPHQGGLALVGSWLPQGSPNARFGSWTWSNGTGWSALDTPPPVQLFTYSANGIVDTGNGPRLHVLGGQTETRLVRAEANGTWTVLGSGLKGGCGSTSSAFATYLGMLDLGSGLRPTVSTLGGTVPALDRVGALFAFDGQDWVPAHGTEVGIHGPISALARHDSGTGPRLHVGGAFCSADGRPALAVARRGAGGWESLPGSVGVNPSVEVLHSCDLGAGPRLFAGGRFAGLGNSAAIVAHDGAGWSVLGSGLLGLPSRVLALADADLGLGRRLYVGGSFTYAGSNLSANIAAWNGSQWIGMGGVNASVHALTVHVEGGAPRLYAGGAFTANRQGPACAYVGRWGGSFFQPVGTGMNGHVWALESFDDGSGPKLYAGGAFTLAGGVSAQRVACWNGAAWTPLGAGFNGLVQALEVFDDGSGPALFAAGDFTHSGATPIAHVARWYAGSWQAVGNGVGPNVQALLAEMGAGTTPPKLWMAGRLETAGTLPTSGLAAWTGCDGPFDNFCIADGTAFACPCDNPGTGGCENSAGTLGATLTPSGTTSPDTLVLRLERATPSTTALLFQADTMLVRAVPFGDGQRCIGGDMIRLDAAQANAGALDFPPPGALPISTRSAGLGDPLIPGVSRSYQAWYRDPDPNFCTFGGLSNASSAVRVVW